MPPATAAKDSQVYFVKKHFSSLTLLFHFYSLCSLLAFFSVWPGRAVALQSMPPAPLTHPHTYTSSSKTPPLPLWHSWGRTAPLKKIWGRPKREAQQQSLCAAAEHSHTHKRTRARTHIYTHQWCQTGFIRVREGGREGGGGRGRRGEEVTAQLGGSRAHWVRKCVCQFGVWVLMTCHRSPL